MAGRIWVAGLGLGLAASLAACVPYTPGYAGSGYPAPAYVAPGYAAPGYPPPGYYDQGYVQPGPVETFGLGGGYVGGDDWRRHHDEGWRGDREHGGGYGDGRPRDPGRRFDGGGAHPGAPQAPQPSGFAGRGGGGGGGFHPVTPAASQPRPAPSGGGGRPMQWWKGS